MTSKRPRGHSRRTPGRTRATTLSPEMRNVRAGSGGRDVIAFLQTLTSPMPPELMRLQEALEVQMHIGIIKSASTGAGVASH